MTLRIACILCLIGCSSSPGGSTESAAAVPRETPAEHVPELPEVPDLSADRATNGEQASAEARRPEDEESDAPPPLDPSWNTPRVSLRPGFQPTPHLQPGQTTIDSFIDIPTNGDCLFRIPERPNLLFVAEADFSHLRVAVLGEHDLTLVVRAPDGEYRCNDDADDLSPMVSGAFPAGTYEIWIGGWNEDPVTYRYLLGFTESGNIGPSDLAPGGVLP